MCDIDYPQGPKIRLPSPVVYRCVRMSTMYASVHPDAPCIEITYQSTLLYGASCQIKCKIGNSHAHRWDVDILILFLGVHANATSASAIATNLASSETNTTAGNGRPGTNGTALRSSTNETYTLLYGAFFPNNCVRDILGLNTQQCIQ